VYRPNLQLSCRALEIGRRELPSAAREGSTWGAGGGFARVWPEQKGLGSAWTIAGQNPSHGSRSQENAQVPEFWTQSFLGTRASFMLDLVTVAMGVVLPVLAASIFLVRRRRGFIAHKRLQVWLGSILAVAVVAFEVDIRFVTDWQTRAEPSPYFERGTWNVAWYCLLIHLACAVPTALLWVTVIVQALRRFPRPPSPHQYSRRHALLGWLAASGMALTALTGWLFYWLAFVAE
jgi:uncharacterized membrane protein YozB (DUF420 family)